MQTDAGVRPNRQHGGKLQVDQPRRDNPLKGQDRMIRACSAEVSVGNLRADDVQHDQWRYQESQGKLRQLPGS